MENENSEKNTYIVRIKKRENNWEGTVLNANSSKKHKFSGLISLLKLLDKD